MRITLISDTHRQHAALRLAGGDMLIHAGDVSGRGHETEIRNFLGWFSEQDYRYKIFIAGNHDFFFEKASPGAIRNLIPPNVVYLQDAGYEADGIRIWGSPAQPWFYDWAFNRQRGADIKKHWDLIPPGTDILVTHGPPHGILDQVARGHTHAGCEELLRAAERIKPALHVFGHIHEGYGHECRGEINYFNASVLDEGYRLANTPFDLEYNSTLKKISLCC